MKKRLTWFTLVWISGGICSCASLNKLPEAELESGYYEFRQPGSAYSNVYAKVSQDSVTIIPIDKSNRMNLGANEVLRKKGFDFDVLIVPFKFRRATLSLPSQLTTDFNGNVFFGYRIDRYKSQFTQTPAGLDRSLRHHAITFGTFGGLGTAFISPWTTDNQTTDEYSGFILTRGLSAMLGVKNLTVGVGVGWDYLADRDKNIWIYQNKPWYGLTLSLNLN